MARYAVAAGNWNDTATWSDTSGGAPGFSVPTVADDVFFDAASPAGTYTVNVSSACLSLDFTGFTRTFAGSSALEIRGSLTLDAGMTRTYTGTVTFSATDSRTITSNGKALDGNLTFNGVGGTWTLQDDLTTGATRATTLTNGTLDINGQTLSTGTFLTNNSNTRAIAFGAGAIELTNASGTTTVWNAASHTGLTVTGQSTGLILISGNNSSARTLSADNSPTVSYPEIRITNGSGGFTVDFAGATLARIEKLTLTSGFSGALTTSAINPKSVEIASSASITSSATGWVFRDAGTIDIAPTMNRPIEIRSSAATVQLLRDLTFGSARSLTLTSGTLDLDTFDLSTDTLVITGTSTRAITGGGDILLTNASGVTTVLDATDMTALTISAWTGALRLTGANASARTILCDASPNVALPAVSVEAGSGGITLTNVVCASYAQTSGYTGILANAALTVAGSVTLNAANGTPEAGAGTLTLTGTGTVSMGGKTFDRPVTINAPAATVTLGAALNIAARALTLTAGTLDADTFSVTAGSLASSNSNTRTLDLGSGTWTLSATGTAWNCATATNLTLTAGTSTVALTDPDVTFAGGGKTYNVVEFARGGTVAITGSNTFATLRLAA